MKKKDKIRKIIVYSLAVLFLLGSIQVHVPSGNPQWMLSEKETVLTSFSEDMKLVDCKKEENENGPFREKKKTGSPRTVNGCCIIWHWASF